jgi:MATE family multidrug resistance protein
MPRETQLPSSFTTAGFLSLALPMIISRAGLAAMGIADGIMVSRFQSRSFAALSLADGTLGRLLDVCIAFLIGGLSLVPRHYHQGDASGARTIWRRTIPVSIGLGVIGLILGLAGYSFLRALGQKPEIASSAAPVMMILGAGYPAALLALSAAVYLEGINRPTAVAVSIVAANVLNIVFNWILIGGHRGVPAMGALGSALSTTIVRCLLGLVLTILAWRSSGSTSQGPNESDVAEQHASRRSQWQLGFGAAGSAAMMVLLGSSLIIFAGWLGVFPLATFSAAWSLAAPGMLIALGLADATGIFVAAAAGRSGERGAASVAWPCLRTTFALIAAISIALIVFANSFSRIYTNDSDMRASMTSVIPIVALILLVDSVGFMMASTLRGIRDIAWPASIEISAMLVLVPVAASLAFGQNLGVRGLFLAMFAAGMARAVMLSCRFLWRLAGVRAAAELEVGV